MDDISLLLEKTNEDKTVSDQELAELFQTPLFSPQAALIHAAAREKSEKACKGKAEIHAQIGINIAPCPNNCKFCSFSAENKIFTDHVELSINEIIERVNQFHDDGANAIYVLKLILP